MTCSQCRRTTSLVDSRCAACVRKRRLRYYTFITSGRCGQCGRTHGTSYACCPACRQKAREAYARRSRAKEQEE